MVVEGVVFVMGSNDGLRARERARKRERERERERERGNRVEGLGCVTGFLNQL
jgi:hypothetical protein